MPVVEKEIDPLERSNTHLTQPQRKHRELLTATTLLSNDHPQTCSSCYQSHSSSTCNNVTDVEARKLVLTKTGRCYTYLKKHDMSRGCRSGIRCLHCQGRHHVSICSRGIFREMMSKPLTTHTSTSTTTCPDTRTPSSNRDPNQSMYMNANRSIILKTVTAIVYNPNQPHLTTKVRLILDSGSQRSYVNWHTYSGPWTIIYKEYVDKNLWCYWWEATDVSCTEFRWDYQVWVKPTTSSTSRSNNMWTIVPTTDYLRNAVFRSFI